MPHDDAAIRSPAHLVALITARAVHHPDRTAFTFLANDDEARQLTYGELDRQARGVAAVLQRTGAEPGDRALVLHPPGLDFIAARGPSVARGYWHDRRRRHAISTPDWPTRRTAARGCGPVTWAFFWAASSS